jgi:hypothetical protein
MKRSFAPFAVGVALLAAPALAFAGGPEPTEEKQKSAAEEFDRGRRLFQAKRYEEAALHFENAFRDAPKSAPLRSAARARLAAGQLDRAATLTALAEERYGDEEGTKELAKEIYPKVTSKLGSAVFSCNPGCLLTVDGSAVGFGEERVATAWLLPGPHEAVVTWSGERKATQALVIKAGEKKSFSENAPAVVEKPVEQPVVLPPPPVLPPAEVHRKPLPKGAFWAGVAVTGVVGTVATISGISTLTSPGKDRVTSECAGLGPECPLYKDALAKQSRTNVLFVVTGVAAVGTAALGLFLVDWTAPRASSGAIRALPTVAIDGRGASVGVTGRF